jgi:PAS domain S-box-containing protein
MRAFAEATVDHEHLFERVAERMCALVGDGAFVAIVSEDRTALEPVAACYRDPEAHELVRRLLAAAGPIQLEGASVGARVFHTRAAHRLHDDDVEALARSVAPNYGPIVRALGARSLLVVPLEIRDKVLGFVSLTRMGAGASPYDDNDEVLALNLAENAALAISNARLLRSVQRELEQRKRAEEAAARLTALIQNSSEFIAMASLEGEILFVNDGGRQLLGLAADQDLSRLRLADFHTAEGMQRGPIIRERGRWQGRGQLRHHKTGELIDTEVSSFLVRDADGKPVCYATVQHDVRETKRLEAQLRQAQKMEAVATLAGGIAHDFNNILGAMLANLELARMDVERGQPPRAHMDEIASAGRRAMTLVQQILTLGRERESKKRIIRLADVVAEVIVLLRSTISARVDLVAAVAPDTPNVFADPTQIHQILMNLCTNAWHALKDRGGRIVVEAAAVSREEVAPGGAPARRWASVRVVDDGHGMDTDTLERIFDPFFTTKSPGEGTGLGLSVVHGLVVDHGGTIRVESAPGKGTTFEVLLPGVDGEVQAPVAPASPRTQRGGRRLLLLDDENVLVRSTEELLRRAGYDVQGFTRADDLLAVLSGKPLAYDLVLTDYNMPRLSGLDVAERVHALRPELPVILLSGHIPERLKQDAARAGVAQVIYKPCALDDLCEVIERHALNKEAQDDVR